ncbi:MAG: GntR family transcriptional regulator [Actinobacteria bacterium]|nr:GntR family transcriptional regulator [Actinomycetota bacterium]
MAIKSNSLALASRRVLSDVVTDDLRDAILSHDLEPGMKIAEDGLAIQLGVSRGPVREALMRLEREGLVTIERHKGARVAIWTEEDIEEVYSMRKALEVLAIQWACKNATEADFVALEEILTRFSKVTEKQRTPKVVSQFDLDFHSAVFESSHHQRLIKTWEVLRSQIHSLLVYTWSTDPNVNKAYVVHWGPDHREILEIIRAKQVAKAKTVILAHIDRGQERVISRFSKKPMKMPSPLKS